MNVLLPQHTYSCIPRDRSARQVSGFQTLGATREHIGDRDVRVIEQRARYQAMAAAPEKYLCYRLPSGSMAVGHICAIPDLDEHGRGGNFLMHTLVASPTLWQQLDSGPFGLFEAGPFLTSLQEALAEAMPRAGDLAPRSLALPDERWDRSALMKSERWSNDFFLEMAHVVTLRHLPQERQMPIVVLGPPEAALPLLALLFALMPPSERERYSFDSYAHGCRWSRDTFFWAVGGLTTNEIPHGAWLIDPQQQTVALDPSATRDATPYERWIKSGILSHGRQTLLDDQQRALALSDALIGRANSPILDEALPELFVRVFASANAQIVIDRAIGALGFPVTPVLRDVLEQQLSRLPPVATLALALNRDDGRTMLDTVFAYVAQTDRHAVRAAHAQHFAKLGLRHLGLALLGSYLTGDLVSHQAALNSCDAETYQQKVVPLVEQWVLPAGSVFTPKHASSWFTQLASYASAEDMPAIAEQMRANLDQLTQFVERLDTNQQIALRDWLIKKRRRTHTLQYALEACVGRAPTFFEHVRQRFTRDSAPASQPRRRR